MRRNLVVSFPGGRGSEIPLLYFAAKYYEDLGYEKIFIAHPATGELTPDALLDNAEKQLRSINFGKYEDIVFTAKSIGTVVACRLKEKNQIPASLILLTPLNETLQYIHPSNRILLVASGAQDRYLDAKLLHGLCAEVGVPCYIEPNVGHRMEVMNDLLRNLEIISNVLRQLH